MNMWLNIIVISVGLMLSLLLFNRFPILKKGNGIKRMYNISVIIPARNEEGNLPLLLHDLKLQTYPLHEIICVDDCSKDKTAEIASSFETKLITVTEKPKDWVGKTWACHVGSEAASGDIFLFLDADVRLSPEAISDLIMAYEENKCVISVQPYHNTVKNYEQFSLFFNIIQIAANGLSMIFPCPAAGLFGPVILIDRVIYKAIKGHAAVSHSITDDIALGKKLTESRSPFKLYLGGEHISFRMYSKSMKDLFHGWTKNFATGAAKTPVPVFLMVFLWVTSCLSVVLSTVLSIINENILYLVMCSLLYVLWVLELYRITRKIGHFKIYAIIFYPVYVLFFLYVFILSFIKKLFRMNVIWKDRKIKLEK
jgi:4,4'-diaponeurosporenoate glycosyltransferase